MFSKPKKYVKSSHATTSFSTLKPVRNEQKKPSEQKESLKQQRLSSEFDRELKEAREVLASYNTEKQPRLVKQWHKVITSYYQDLEKNKRYLDMEYSIDHIKKFCGYAYCFLFLIQNIIQHGSKNANVSLQDMTQKNLNMLATFTELYDVAKKDSNMQHFITVNRALLDGAEAYVKAEIEQDQKQSAAKKPKA